MMKSFAPSFMRGSQTRRQEKPSGQTGAEAAGEGAARLGRFGKTMKDEKKGEDAVGRIQRYAREEGERQRKKKAEEEAAKKKASETKSTAPEKGFFSRMYEKYVSGKKEQ